MGNQGGPGPAGAQDTQWQTDVFRKQSGTLEMLNREMQLILKGNFSNVQLLRKSI